jgi:hypothetical protein
MGYASALYHGHYVDVKVLYTLQFKLVPAIVFIGELDGTRAFRYLNGRFQYQATAIYQHNYFDHEKKEILFNNTLFVFKDKRMIELAGSHCHVLHTVKQYKWACELVTELAQFRLETAAVSDVRVIGFARSNTMN